MVKLDFLPNFISTLPSLKSGSNVKSRATNIQLGVNMLRYIFSVILFAYATSAAAVEKNLPFDYNKGDTFSCLSDALISISSDGHVTEYKNEVFGLTINQNETVSFTKKYPLNPLGRIVEFNVTELAGDMKLTVNDFFFAYLKRKTPEEFTLLGFNLAVTPSMLQATCERL